MTIDGQRKQKWPPEGVDWYYTDSWVAIACGDAQELVRELDLSDVNVVVTDPPYGIEGGSGNKSKKRAKGDYGETSWTDDREYVRTVCVPVIEHLLLMVGRVVLTPGNRCLRMYPQWDDMGDFWSPASPGVGPWGFQTCNPILYYGKDPRGGKGIWPNGAPFQNLPIEKNLGHPCPKPYRTWKWLVEKASLPGEVVLDPFAGSGTTALAAMQLGRKSVLIEIEERFCRIAVERLCPTALRDRPQ